MSERETLCRLMGYSFRDESLLDLALTHRSFGAVNNERLEFLGDSLLNMIIAEALYRRFEAAQEGDLSRLRASLVNGETLASLGREFQLGELLRLGIGERNSGGAQRESILADAVEALIGAMYSDSDFDTCRQRVLQWFASRLQGTDPSASNKDAKTRLQEYLQARKQGLPRYRLLSTSGAEHQQIFTVSCQVALLSRAETASGSNRRRAEQVAAEQVLKKLQALS